MTGRRRRHEAAVILAGGAVLVAADLAVWALYVLWHLLPVLLPAAVVVLARRRWKLHRRAWAALTQDRPAQPVRVIPGHVISGDNADRAELARLRDDNAKLQTKVRALSDMLTGGDS